jgi:hypothetical protein
MCRKDNVREELRKEYSEQPHHLYLSPKIARVINQVLHLKEISIQFF